MVFGKENVMMQKKKKENLRKYHSDYIKYKECCEKISL